MILELPAEKICNDELVTELKKQGLKPLAIAVIVEKIGKEDRPHGG